MAVWSEISLSLIEQHRVDAEYYQPKYLEANKKAGDKRLKHYGIEVIHPSEVKRVYSDSGIQIVLAQNNRNNRFDWSVKKYMPCAMRTFLNNNKLNFGDVTVTRSGANVGQTSVVTIETESNELFACADILIIKSGLISGCLVSTYLNSNVGKKLMERGVYGAGQPHIAPSYVKEIPIPEYLLPYSELIESIVIDSRTKSQLSVQLYEQASKLLLDYLCLDKLDVSNDIYSLSSFEEMVNGHRLDAQHYQSKFKALINHLQEFPNQTIRKLRSVNRRGLQPNYVENGEFSVINSQHITSSHLAYDNFEKTSAQEFLRAKEAHIQKDDVLIYTTGAYIGQTNLYDSDAPAMASNHVNILRVDGIDSGYLTMVLQSIVGSYQTEKYARGSAQAELYPSDIEKFVIPLLDDEKQLEIGNLLRKSLVTKKESEQLLEQAKSRVEELIEGAI